MPSEYEFIKQLIEITLLGHAKNRVGNHVSADVRESIAWEFVMDAVLAFLTGCSRKAVYNFLWHHRDQDEAKIQIALILKRITSNKITEHRKSKQGFLKYQGILQKMAVEDCPDTVFQVLPTVFDLPSDEALQYQLTQCEDYFTKKSLVPKEIDFLMFHIESIIAGYEKKERINKWSERQGEKIKVKTYEKKLYRIRQKLVGAGASVRELYQKISLLLVVIFFHLPI